jgi:nicotinamidase-related amidase
MPIKSQDLHGNVPDDANAVLLLIDVINDFEFEGGESLFKPALSIAENIASLKRRARQVGIPAIYVNDNFGRWRSDFKRLVRHCVSSGVRGKPVAELLLPDDEDYFVLKPKHSGFFSTSLDLLLEHLGASKLILTGIAGNNCVLFTANDAYMRDFELFVPADCVVSETAEENDYALNQMKTILKADITPSVELDVERLVQNEEAVESTSVTKTWNETGDPT